MSVYDVTFDTDEMEQFFFPLDNAEGIEIHGVDHPIMTSTVKPFSDDNTTIERCTEWFIIPDNILGGNDWQRVHRADYITLLQNFWTYVTERTNSSLVDQTVLASICWAGPAQIVGPRENEVQPGRNLVAQAIRTTIGDDHFVQSNDITGIFGRSRDGLHFTYGGAIDWMRQMTPRLVRCVKRQHSDTILL